MYAKLSKNEIVDIYLWAENIDKDTPSNLR